MIRPVTPADLWTLRRKPRSSAMLYNEAMLAQPHRTFWFGLRCAIEGPGREGATLVYRERGMQAMIQATGRPGRPELDIVQLAAYGGGPGHPTDPDAWFRLLEALVIYAGHHRVQRLYAALSQRHEELRELFRQVGFGAYTHQTVLRLDGPDWDQGTTLAPMRPQHRRDVWAIHKLYGAITPHSIQHAEAREARTWMLPLTRGWSRPAQRAWVLGREDDLTAYLHLSSGSAGHVLALLVRPEARDLTTDVLRFGLGQISDTLPVYLLLRDYQQELMLPAGDLGFQPIGEQALLFKQTTVAVRRSILVPALEPRTETQTPIATIAIGSTSPAIPTNPSTSEDARPYARAQRYHQ
ncbi:MAG TPA: hypothetical protein VNL77_02225 [Roseiflexaceae bacterium]|nr:hypothetical protein [Roseiflexaceae bacterium]